MTTEDKKLCEAAYRHALPDPHDEREVLHAPLLRDLAQAIERLNEQRDELLAALEKLARLGNGDQYGSSIGNQIAIEAIAKVKGGAA